MKIKAPRLIYNNPIGQDKLNEMITLLEISTEDTIVDIGGGRGDALIQMIETNQATGILIDIDKRLMDERRALSESMIKTGQLQLIEEDAKTYLKELKAESIDCFVCIAASHALDGYMSFIKAIIPYLKPGGFVLVGEGFWMKKPSKEYLELLGGEESELAFHYENIARPEKLGLTYLYSLIASRDDWDRFEGVYFLEEELKAAEIPKEDREKKLQGLRSFRNAQYQYGRETMGFGLYLFRKN